MLEVIRRNVEHEARLIDDLLDLSRVTRGTVTLHPEVVDVHQCVRTVLEMCRGEIDDKGLAVSTSLRASHYLVWADPARIRQVLWNVLQNAVRFTQEGGRIDIRTANAEGGRLRVQVKDTGIGIEPEAMGTIFNAFAQGEKTLARKYGGLGLGLSIAKMLLDLHPGAALRAESEGRDRGATFTLEFDAVRAPVVQAPHAPAALRLVQPGGKRPLRLLVVEDHPDSREMLALQLTSAGYIVETAAGVGEALALASSAPYDLLISDLGLPDGSGLDLMRQVKERHGLRGIAVSGFGMDEDVTRSRAAGFEHHLIKPVNWEALNEIIERVAS